MDEERTIEAAQGRIRELEAEIARLRGELAEAASRGREELLASEERRLAVLENILD
ncbi:MAG: hypothetical protein IH608_09440, partial [Proteobacteria bacterium]|nr:hypothetical protein [Pseudomonadota bacterium]